MTESVIKNDLISCNTESVEKRKFSDLKTEVECDHLKGGEIHEWERNVWVWFTYCPLCGVKL